MKKIKVGLGEKEKRMFEIYEKKVENAEQLLKVYGTDDLKDLVWEWSFKNSKESIINKGDLKKLVEDIKIFYSPQET